MPNRRNQEQHDRTVEIVALALASNRYLDVRADVPQAQRPSPVGAAMQIVPDITASKSGTTYVFEVETEDTIQDENSEQQWRTFADYARQVDGRFILVVPTGCVDAARQQISRLQIQAEVWSA